MLIALDTLEKPKYAERAWCLYEVWVAVDASMTDIQVALSEEAVFSFRNGTRAWFPFKTRAIGAFFRTRNSFQEYILAIGIPCQEVLLLCTVSDDSLVSTIRHFLLYSPWICF